MTYTKFTMTDLMDEIDPDEMTVMVGSMQEARNKRLMMAASVLSLSALIGRKMTPSGSRGKSTPP